MATIDFSKYQFVNEIPTAQRTHKKCISDEKGNRTLLLTKKTMMIWKKVLKGLLITK